MNPHRSSPHGHRLSHQSMDEHERLKLLEFMVNHIAEEVMLMDREGRIVYVNEAAVREIGFPRATILSRRVNDFFREKISIATWRKRYLRPLKRSRKPMTFSLERVVRGGKRQTIEVNAVYLVYREHEYILSIARDISTRKRIADLMEESQRMRTIFNFISGMSQEIHAPLILISAYTQKLLDRFQDRPFEYVSFKEFSEILSTVRRVRDQIRSCCATTERLITLHKRKMRGHHKRCDVNIAIRDVVRLLHQQCLTMGIKIQQRLSNSLPVAAIGPMELNQVVQNLVLNAMQAMPAGGNLTVRTAFQRKSRQIIIDIEDEGVGIPPEHLSRVFEPFFTTKERGAAHSAGLGLSTVYSIVTSCQGDIKITSSLRRGTLVRVFLRVAV